MSRSDYSDDGENYAMWRGMVASATRGKRGQALFRDLLSAMDTMPEKRLIAHKLEAHGEVCALGAVGKYRCVNMVDLNPEEPEDVAAAFDIATCLAREVAYMNDEAHYAPETPEQRWVRMREWVAEQVRPAQQHGTEQPK